MSEAKKARASLRKTAAYANELISMITPDCEVEGWVQAKIIEMDHHIESIYGYYKFGDVEESEEKEESEEEEESEEDSEEEDKPRVIFVMPTTLPIP